MITCEFIDRLGNNMFQIATTYGLAYKYNEVAEFDSFKYFDLPGRTHKIEYLYKAPENVNPILDIPYHKNMCIKGWFQRTNYFDFIREQLIEDIFKVPRKPEKNTICVHVRRGDFLQNTIDFPVQPDSYYINALNEIGYWNKRIVFCSDDIPYCKIHFGHIPKVEFRENTDPLQDIYFGANCEHVVMSNSTFSFWMAYLNRNPNKVVIFPLHWFSMFSGRDGREICSDINWIGR